MAHQKELEIQFRKLKSIKEQQQEIFKITANDLQEPLRKAVFTGNFLLTGREHLGKDVDENQRK